MQEAFTGQLLVASTLVTEPIYSGGVCLVVHEQDDDVIGVMLNRPLRASGGDPKVIDSNQSFESNPSTLPGEMGDRYLSSVASSQPQSSQPQSSQPPNSQPPPSPEGSADGQSSLPLPIETLKMLHFGGPIAGPVVAVHQNEQLAEAETGQGVYVAAQRHHLEDLVRQPSHPYRLIVGHIHWSRAQLEHELAAGVWHRLPATRQAVFGTPDEMWHGMIRRATTRSMSQWIGTADVPNAYELN